MYPALCPISRGNLFQAPSGMLTSSIQTANLQPLEDEDLVKKNGGNRDSLQQPWRIMTSLSTFPFLVQWQRPNSYFQLLSGLPFPMSSKCPILPRVLSSLEEGDVSQKGSCLDWGFLATPAYFFHCLIPTHCLCRVSNTQKGWGKSKAHSTWLTEAMSRCSIWEQHNSARITRQRHDASPMTWSEHRQVTFKQLNPNSAFVGIKCLTGKGHCL